MPHRKDFEREPSEKAMRILAVIRRVPRGRVLTYGRVAELAGLPGRARLVGHVLKTSPLADQVPWYRIVNATGHSSLTGDNGTEQRRRLRAEGVGVGAGGRIDLKRYLWRPRRRKEGLKSVGEPECASADQVTRRDPELTNSLG